MEEIIVELRALVKSWREQVEILDKASARHKTSLGDFVAGKAIMADCCADDLEELINRKLNRPPKPPRSRP